MPRKVIDSNTVQKMLNMAHIQHQKHNLDKIFTIMGASGPNILQLHLTPTILSSAQLMATHIKHNVLRNLQHMTTTNIKDILEMTEDKHAIWKHSSDQQARIAQCAQAKHRLEQDIEQWKFEMEMYTSVTGESAPATAKDNKSKASSPPPPPLPQTTEDVAFLKQEASAVAQKIHVATKELEKLNMILAMAVPRLTGSLHPHTLSQGRAVFMTPTEQNNLPSPTSALRGLLIKLKGPRRGNRSMVWKKSCGRISTNSVGWVVSDEAKVPIFSKVGVFGLTVRIVYSLRKRLQDPLDPVRVLDAPGGEYRFALP